MGLNVGVADFAICQNGLSTPLFDASYFEKQKPNLAEQYIHAAPFAYLLCEQE
ncbi:hypothetical protein [Lactobacillus intestinalis]|uniref:hypothetical protein n=1 Tax=Lactobacillus intestinalis TaxID=151781 RepID=UPI003F673E6B